MNNGEEKDSTENEHIGEKSYLLDKGNLAI